MSSSLNDDVKLIYDEMQIIKELFLKVISIIPSFNIMDDKILPYGLKPHTRSISWIVEQVITQQTKYNAKKLGISGVDIDVPDTSLHDCVIEKDGKKFFVNIKIHQTTGKNNKNDIAAVEKLYMQYNLSDNYRLIYATFGFSFDNLTINFTKDAVHVFSPQFLPIYVNPRNDKIQSYYHHDTIHRTRAEFLQLLRSNSKSIVLV